MLTRFAYDRLFILWWIRLRFIHSAYYQTCIIPIIIHGIYHGIFDFFFERFTQDKVQIDFLIFIVVIDDVRYLTCVY